VTRLSKARTTAGSRLDSRNVRRPTKEKTCGGSEFPRAVGITPTQQEALALPTSGDLWITALGRCSRTRRPRGDCAQHRQRCPRRAAAIGSRNIADRAPNAPALNRSRARSFHSSPVIVDELPRTYSDLRGSTGSKWCRTAACSPQRGRLRSAR